MEEKLINKRGITLIALIITIIVMLILVAVSVTVALNGRLFTTAKTAVDNTTIERDRELALSNGDIIDEYVSGGSQSNRDPLTSDWWRPTAEEESQMEEHGNELYAAVSGDSLVVEFVRNDPMYFIHVYVASDTQIMLAYVPDDEEIINEVSTWSNISSSGWYTVGSFFNYRDAAEYSGGCPNVLYNLSGDEIKSQTYLDRVIQSLEENANS